MFNIRFNYLPNCLHSVREGWDDLTVSFTTNVDGHWRAGTSTLKAVQAYARKHGLEVRASEPVRGNYELTFLSAEDAAMEQAEEEWAQAEDWAHCR